jgi:hypothetical protein
MTVNHGNQRPIVPREFNRPAFEPADSIRLHGIGVKFPDMLLIEVSNKEVVQRSDGSPACISTPA